MMCRDQLLKFAAYYLKQIKRDNPDLKLPNGCEEILERMDERVQARVEYARCLKKNITLEAIVINPEEGGQQTGHATYIAQRLRCEALDLTIECGLYNSAIENRQFLCHLYEQALDRINE